MLDHHLETALRLPFRVCPLRAHVRIALAPLVAAEPVQVRGVRAIVSGLSANARCPSSARAPP
eukprot:5199843-Alexandrium_andersonii.AAC.1